MVFTSVSEALVIVASHEVALDARILTEELGIYVNRLFQQKVVYQAVAAVSKIAKAVFMRQPELGIASD